MLHDKLVLFRQEKIWRYQFEQQVISTIETSSKSNRIANLSDIDYANKRVLFSVYNDIRKDLVMLQR